MNRNDNVCDDFLEMIDVKPVMSMPSLTVPTIVNTEGMDRTSEFDANHPLSPLLVEQNSTQNGDSMAQIPEELLVRADNQPSLRGHRKAYWCYRCNPPIKISRAWNLKRHIQSRHAPEKLYSCLWCVKRFGSKYSLHLHIRSLHRAMLCQSNMDLPLQPPTSNISPAIQMTTEDPNDIQDLPVCQVNSNTDQNISTEYAPAVGNDTKMRDTVATEESDASTSDTECDEHKMKSEINRLRYRKEHYKIMYEQLKAKSSNIVQLQTENDSLKAQLRVNQPNYFNETTTKIKFLESKLLEVRKDGDKLMEYSQEKEKECTLLKQEIQKLRTEKDKFHSWLLEAPILRNS